MKKISESDIFSDLDIFKSIRDSANKTLITLEKLNVELKETAVSLKSSLSTDSTNSTKGINNLNTAQSKANQLLKESIEIDKLKHQAEQQRIKSEQEIERLLQQQQKTQQSKSKTDRELIALQKAQTTEAERLAKAQQKVDDQNRKANSAYNQLVVSTRNLKNEAKELAAQLLRLEANGGKGTAQFNKLSNQLKVTQQAAQNADITLKKIDSQVGDNFRNVGNYEGALQKLKAGLGSLGLAFGGAMIFQAGAKELINFNQQIADLSAITGAAGADLEFYGQQANKLGANVEGGASAVVEAYKLIGSAKPELLENAQALDAVTQSAITLSQASGMALPEAATALTDAMNQFGASAEEADKFVNVLANGAKFGAAEIPQITESLLKFGAVAKSTNTPIEESVALIEALAEKGLKGAESGTALRNVMLKLSAPDALPKEAQKRLDEMGISMEKLADPTITMTEKLKMMKPALSDVGGLIKVFGVENSVAAMNLIQTTNRTEELTGQMHTLGTGTKQAEDRTNTLGHAIMEIKNNFLALFTQMGQGGSSMQTLIDAFKFIGANLGTIASIIGKVIRTWLIYKAVQKSIQVSNWVTAGGFKQLGMSILQAIPGTRAYTLAQIQAARANAAAGTSAKVAGNAMKTIPWVAIISGLVELYNWWHNVASASAEARRQADLYKQAQENAKQKALDVSESTKKAYDEEIRKSDLLYRTKIANAKSATEKAKLEKEMMTAQVKIQDRYIQKNKDVLYSNQENARYVKVLQKEYVKLSDKFAKWGGTVEETARSQELFDELIKYGVNMTQGDKGFTERVKERINTRVATLDANVNQLGKDIKSFQDINDEAEVAVLEASINQGDYNVHIDKSNEKIPKLIDNVEQVAIAYQGVNDYLTETIALTRELNQIYENREIAKVTKEIDDITAAAKKKVADEDTNVVMGVTIKATSEENDDKTNAQIEEDNLKKLTEANTELNRKIKERTDLLIKQAEVDSQTAKNKLIADDAKAQQDEIDKLKAERDKFLLERPKDAAEINKKYDEQVAKLAIENKERTIDLNTKLLIEDEKLVDAKKLLLDKNVTDTENANKEILDSKTKSNQAVAKVENEEEKKLDDKRKQRLADEKAIIDEIADYFIRGSEKKIAQAEKEITALEKTQGMLEELAKNGNINATQSLAENNRLIAEANKKKERELKRMEMIKLASSVYTTYNKNLEKGSKNPLADTIKDVALLQAFIRTIPTFEAGTEDTGTHGQGVDGKGGFKAILHPNERVIPKSLNDQLKGLSNAELTKLAVEYKNGKVVNKFQSEQMQSSLEFSLLLSKVDTLNKTIENKPETNIELGAITSSIMEIIQSTKKGNKTVYNRFKIRK
jgi:TP901 family phage tail tape measure protein